MSTKPEAAADSCAIFVAEIDQMGGAERSLLALSRWLCQHNRAHHFVTYEDRANLPAHASHPVTVIQLRPRMRTKDKIASLRGYFGADSNHRQHLKHPRHPKLLASGYQAALHATIAGVRGFHCLMHDTPPLFEEAAMHSAMQGVRRLVSNLVVARGLRSGGRTMVTSQYLQADCRRLFGVEADIVRMGGFGTTRQFAPRRVEGQLNLLSVSRIESNKRVDWMLHALAGMNQSLSKRVDWRLDVCGSGSQLEAMRALATRLKLSGRVLFQGHVSDLALDKAYAQAHLFLMPAVQGYGIPAIEALQRGLPVVLHRDSGVSDILLDTPWATVVQGGREEWTRGMERAITSVMEGAQLQDALPDIPDEDDWAESVAGLCGWV